MPGKRCPVAGKADPKDRPEAGRAGGAAGLGGKREAVGPALPSQHPLLRVMQLRVMPAFDMPERSRKAQ